MPRKGAASARVTLARSIGDGLSAKGRALPSTLAARPPALSRPATRRSPRAGPLAVSVNWPGPLPTATTGSSPSMAIRALPSSALSLPVRRTSPTCSVLASTSPCPASTRRTAPRLPSMPSLASPSGRLPPSASCACSLAGAMARARAASACAVLGAKRCSSAIIGAMAGASKSTVMLPCGDVPASSRPPLAEKVAPPRSATESRSICQRSASTFTRALISWPSTPAMVARPISAVIAMSCGRSSVEPASTASPKPSATSRSSSGALSVASNFEGWPGEAKV